MPYDEQGQYYDRIRTLGNTTIYVIEPKLTEDELLQRLKSLENTISGLLNCTVDLSFKK